MTTHQQLALKAVIGIMRTHGKLIKSLKSYVADKGINMTEFSVLELLQHRGKQPIQQIAERILVGSSSIAYVISQLEKKALIEREIDPEDRRVCYIHLSGSGRALMEEVFPPHAQRIDQIFGAVDEAALTQLLATLRQLDFELE